VSEYLVGVKVFHYVAVYDVLQYFARNGRERYWSIICRNTGMLFSFLEDGYNKGISPIMWDFIVVKGTPVYSS
jgi:hypothetical protein